MHELDIIIESLEVKLLNISFNFYYLFLRL